jgi:hypothetical protein
MHFTRYKNWCRVLNLAQHRTLPLGAKLTFTEVNRRSEGALNSLELTKTRYRYRLPEIIDQYMTITTPSIIIEVFYIFSFHTSQ